MATREGIAHAARDELRILVRSGVSRRGLFALAFATAGSATAKDAIRRLVADEQKRSSEAEGLLDRLDRIETKIG